MRIFIELTHKTKQNKTRLYKQTAFAISGYFSIPPRIIKSGVKIEKGEVLSTELITAPN